MLSATNAAAWRCEPIQILDQHHLVTLFIVNELIDEFFRQQHTETARPQSLLFTDGHMAEQIFGRASNGCVAKLLERETLSGIFNPAGYSPARTNEGNFHVLAGIEMGAMFHGVD